MEVLPRELFVRQEQVQPHHYFPPHRHNWHQLLYAVSGVLVVDLEGQRYFIPPEQAIWIPTGFVHGVYSEYGADLKSLYVTDEFSGLAGDRATVLHITPLIRELILHAAGFEVEYPVRGYENDLVQLLLQSLLRCDTEERFLPWPVNSELAGICNQLYKNPDNTESSVQLASSIGTSVRTLDRRFRRDTGMTLKQWRVQLKLMQAIELLNTGMNITAIALELGYSSPSPFIYMFREHMGISPAQYRKETV